MKGKAPTLPRLLIRRYVRLFYIKIVLHVTEMPISSVVADDVSGEFEHRSFMHLTAFRPVWVNDNHGTSIS